MRRTWKIRLAWLAAAALTAAAVQSRTHAESHEAQTTSASRIRIPSVPLFFVPNQGQSDAAVRFQTRALGGAAFFTATEVVLALPQPGSVVESQRASLPGDPRTAALGNERGVPVKFVRVRLVGASPALRVEGETRLPALVHEFRQSAGSSPRSNLPTFASVLYRDLYEGVDLQYAEDNGRLKATYTVAPGVDPSIVRWRYEGAAFPHIDAAGNLRVGLSQSAAAASNTGELSELTPAAWQDIAGQRRPVEIRYAVAADGSVGFSLPNGYDRTQPLTLDPTLTYSTFLGGGGDDNAYDVAVDSAGFAYVVGRTLSVDFPTGGALDPGCGTDGNCDGFGFYDAFVTKLNPSASGAASLVFSTYLGGSANDFGLRVRTRTDLGGNVQVYVTGIARENFPTTASAYDSTYGGAPGADAFLSVLSANGSQLLYSTYLGGSNGDGAWGLDVDANGVAALAGQTFSTNFPTVGAFDASCGSDGTCNTDQSDAFVARLNPAVAGAAGLLYSTYLGGSGSDQAYGVAYDSTGRLHVVGRTPSTDFPTSASARQPVNGGPGGTLSGPCFAFELECDAFVSVLAPSGGTSGLAYSTYLGGFGYEDGYSVAVDASGNTHVVGSTFSGDFPTTANALQPSFGGTNDAYLAKFSPGATGAASLPYATYLGGSDDDQGYGLALLGSVAHVTGFTRSTNFPSAGSPFQPTNGGAWDAFVLKLNPTIAGSPGLSYATYLGGLSTDATYGIAVEASGAMTVTGQSFSANFPVVNGYQNLLVSGSDAIVARINTAATAADLSVTQADTPDPIAAFNEITYTVTITNNGPNTATGVRLADVISSGPSLQSFVPSQGSCLQDFSTFENDLGCDLGTLTIGASATVTLRVLPFSEGTVVNTARGSGNVSDPNATNNVAAESTSVVTPSLSIDSVMVLEGNAGTSNAVFTVTLSPASTQTVTVDYSTANGTATAGSDYTAGSGTLTFSPGTTTQPLRVAVIGDTNIEASETFFVNLANAGGASIATGAGQGTITNDDFAPDLEMTQVSVPASASPGGMITVSNTVKNTGGGTSGGFRVGLYLSNDSTCSTSDAFMASRAVISLAPGATNAANTSVTIPAGTPLGTRFVCAIADDLAQVAEANDANNAASAAINVLPAIPVITLKINGQHPTPPTVTVAGPTRLTIDVAASTYSASVNWYWKLIYNGQVRWVTPSGALSAVPTPWITHTPVPVSNVTLLNLNLPPASTLTNVVFMVNGTTLVASDQITARRP